MYHFVSVYDVEETSFSKFVHTVTIIIIKRGKTDFRSNFKLSFGSLIYFNRELVRFVIQRNNFVIKHLI